MSKKNSAAAERIRAMQEAQAAAEKRRQALRVAALVAVIIVCVVGIGIAVQSTRDGAGGSTAPPAGVSNDFGVVRGDADAAVTVTLYEDFQCPACKNIEQLVGARLAELVDDKTITVDYRPIAILDNASTTDYSTRSTATAACVVDSAGSDAYFALHDLLFEMQPPEGGAGLTDPQLAQLAAQAGADAEVVASCQEEETFVGWVDDATDAASKNDVTGTPTILIDGEKLEFQEDEDPLTTLTAAIDAARG